MNSFDDDLRRKDIYASWITYVEDYLDNMKNKKSEIEDDYSNDYEKDEIRREYELKLLKIGHKYEEDNTQIDIDFEINKRRLEREMQDKRNYHNNEMISKIKTRNNLQNTLYQTRNDNPKKRNKN